MPWTRPYSDRASYIRHGQSFNLTGGSYSSKSRAMAPLLRDKCTATQGTVDSQWDGGTNGGFNVTYQAYNNVLQSTTFDPNSSGISVPNGFVGGKYGGAQYGNNLPWSVFLTKKIILPTLPCCIEINYRERCDPGSALGLGHGAGPNLKVFGWSDLTSGINPDSLFLVFNPGSFDNTTSTYQIAMGDNSNIIMENPDRNSHNNFWSQELNPYNAANGWKRIRMKLCIDQTTGAGGVGYLQRYCNGVRTVNYAGRTDNFAGTTRYVSIPNGVFSNDYGDQSTTPSAIANWDWVSDIMIDATAGSTSGAVAGVYAGNKPTLAASDILVAQDLTGGNWANPEIDVAGFWQGELPFNQPCYMHAQREDGVVMDNQRSFIVIP